VASRGEYSIVPRRPRAIAGERREHAETFNPAASRSRFGITDSGVRYEVRLDRAGRAHYRTHGQPWRLIAPPGNVSPVFWSFHDVRRGRRLQDVRFEMIAAGRGRCIAKERGTERVFHLVMDELFRTYPPRTKRPRLGLRPPDPPVPGNYWKLDPEFFQAASTSPTVPDDLLRAYNRHPASLRFPLFRLVLAREIVDGTIVVQRPREWHLIDGRSPHAAWALSDLNPLRFTAADYRSAVSVATLRPAIRDVLRAVQAALSTPGGRRAADSVAEWSVDALDAALAAADETALTQVILSAFPRIPRAVRPLLRTWVRLAVRSLVGVVQTWTRDDLATTIRDEIVDQFVETAASGLARGLRRELDANGGAALVFPMLTCAALFVASLHQDGDVPPALRARDGEYQVNPGRLLRALTRTSTPAGISRILDALVVSARERELRTNERSWLANGRLPPRATTPNPPPPDLPAWRTIEYRHVATGTVDPRWGIAYDRVLDLGVGYSHWSEQYQDDWGGEIHAVRSRSALAQHEGFNSVLYRFLNGPVVDGDASIDGTTNFYMLVRLAPAGEPDGPAARPAKGRAHPTPIRQRFAVLWIDEQTYFTQRWRLLHPTKDVLGDSLSLQRTLHDDPARFAFDGSKFWEPFVGDRISEASRMVVRRQLVAVTGYDRATKRHEIYTIAFNYGICDRSWRYRTFPDGAAEKQLAKPVTAQPALPSSDAMTRVPIVYVNTLELRDDLTFRVAGWTPSALRGAPAVSGWYYQRYLPATQRHTPDALELRPRRKPSEAYAHPWHFLSRRAAQAAERFYQFGVYEDPIESRCQFYEVELLSSGGGVGPVPGSVDGGTWRNVTLGDDRRLRFHTRHVDWQAVGARRFVAVADMAAVRSPDQSLSMYEPHVHFRLQSRGPLGLIAVFADKRDDELQPASFLPQKTGLRRTADLGAAPRSPGAPPPRPSSPQELRLLARAHRRVDRAPRVPRVRVELQTDAAGGLSVALSFWSPDSDDELNVSVWKVRMAALEHDGSVVPLLETLRVPHFVRRIQPTGPLAAGDDGSASEAHRHDAMFVVPTDAVVAMRRFCTPRARVEHGTSVWFEDVVGHRATPDILEFS
jgi:hypothetical protein